MNDSLSRLQSVIDASGLWRGERAQTHKILLSPSVHRITESQRAGLESLGVALGECLRGLSHIAVIAYEQSANHRGTWAKIRQIFSTGVPRIYHQFQAIRIRDIPRLLKLDLMVDTEGQFRIAEIDGHNKHGVGYSTLGMKFRDVLSSGSTTLPGVAKLIAEDARLMKHSEVKIFYADQERFYIPEFEIAQREIESHGVGCRLFSEMEATTEMLQSGLFLDLPFLYQKPAFYEAIGAAYRAGRVRFIIPPKPFLGAKAVLALLRNDSRNPKVEAILQAFIDDEMLRIVRRYIPPTFFVGKQALRIHDVEKLVSSRNYVLKEFISSGMKGTVFSTDPDFVAMLARADRAGMNYILQEEVLNQPQEFSWFDGQNDSSELRTSADWFMRVTVHYVNSGLADIIVTARRDKAVHGGKDCLQLGTIVI